VVDHSEFTQEFSLAMSGRLRSGSHVGRDHFEGEAAAAAAAADSPMVPHLRVPFLSSFAKSAFERFRVDHEAYVLRGGDIPMRKCIFSDLMPVLELQLPGVDFSTVEDAALLKALVTLWAPRSRTETIDQLRAIRCAPGSLKPGSGEIAQYCSAYTCHSSSLWPRRCSPRTDSWSRLLCPTSSRGSCKQRSKRCRMACRSMKLSS